MAEKRYIIQEIDLDQFTTLRKRIEIKPCVCEVCGMNVMDQHNARRAEAELPPIDYEDLPEQEQEVMGEVIRRHKELAHTGLSSKKIITEDELKQLGNPAQAKEMLIGGSRA